MRKFMTPKKKVGWRFAGRRGVAAVEFALIAPVMVFMVVGLIEMGRGLMVKDILGDATRKGCRTGILPSGTNALIIADVNQVLTDNNLTPGNATITILVNGNAVDVSTAKAGDQIAVKVSMPVSAITLVTPLYLPNIDIVSETLYMMRQG
jgi:Flp pilus assembly protein TadG